MYSKKHAKLVGKIIFANFLAHPLEKYKNIIEKVENSPLFKRFLLDGLIIVRDLSQSGDCSYRSQSQQVIARIEKHSKWFSIKYTHEYFNREYVVSREILDKLSIRNDAIYNLFHKLRRISSRNKITHEILNVVLKHQKRYFQSGNALHLAPLTQKQISNQLKKIGIGYIDASIISRLINNKSIITPFDTIISLKSLFSTQKEINRKLIKHLLDKESEDLQFGKLRKPYTDNEIRLLIEDRLPCLSRRSVTACRRELGIPDSWRRSYRHKYPPHSLNFSSFYLLEITSVNNNAPCDSGVYELRLNGTEIKYPIASTPIIYIGRAKNIKKRLKDHLRSGSKNGSIKEFLRKHRCLFRYILAPKKWKDEEKKLYNLFVSTYGASPICNKVHP